MLRIPHLTRLTALMGLLAAASAHPLSAAPPAAPGSFAPGRLLVSFRPNVTPQRADDLVRGLGARKVGEINGIGVQVLQLPPQASPVAAAQAFAGKPQVLFAEPDWKVQPADFTPNDPWYPNQPQLRKIEAPAAWDTTVGTAGIVIAILDTGVYAQHEDLSTKLVAGWNTYDNNSNSSDVAGHGTRVAGTAGAAGHNGKGVASVAWGCKIMPVRISDPQAYGYASTASAGLTWAADHGARVANVSYDFTDSATVASAARYFSDRGGVVTMSAGNSSVNKTTPDNPYVLTVTAVDGSDVIASWSNYGSNVDLAAPSSALTTTNTGGYATASGTSFSAPTVAGVAALVLSANPNLSGPQAQDIVKQSADDRGPTGWDIQYGWGRVNARGAVAAAGGGGSPAPDTTPPSVSFTAPAAGASVSGTVTLQANASDNAGVSSVTFSVDGTALLTDTSSPYSAAWNTASVANGEHTLRASAVDTAGNAAVSDITVTVANAAADASPPSTQVISPGQGSTVTGTSVTITAAAADNVGVVRVEFYVDGVLSGTDSSAPYSGKWSTRKAAKGAHSIHSRAFDAAGNSASSAPVTVYR